MEFDFSKLSGRIVEKYGTRSAFATAAGRTSSWLSARLNNSTQWSPDEIFEVSRPELLDIPPEQFHTYFFKPKFDK